MINWEQLLEYVITPAINRMGVGGKSAENLLLLTACAESRCGYYIHQVGGGPAKGIFQMEPATHDDIWDNYLQYRPHYATAIEEVGSMYLAEELTWNLMYAAMMTRAHYLRVMEPLPPAWDDWALAEYYKQYYNTYLGAATVEEAVEKYREIVGPF